MTISNSRWIPSQPRKIIAWTLCASLLDLQAVPLLAQSGAEAASLSTLESVEVLPDQVRLRLSAPPQYSTFVTMKPPRLVLEMQETEFRLLSKVQPGKGRQLKRVRAGQFKSAPHPVTRVVMDLATPVSYRTQLDGNDLLVRLESEAEATVQAESEQAAPAPAAELPPPAPAPAPLAVRAPPAAGGAPVWSRQLGEAAVPARPAGRAPASGGTDVREKEDAAPMSTDGSEELAAMARRGSVSAEEGTSEDTPPVSNSPSRPPAGAFPRSTYRKSRRDIVASMPRDIIELHVENEEVGNILKMLAAKAGVNLIYGSDVAGTLSLHLNDVPFHEVFSLVLAMKGLTTTQVGDNVLRVLTPATLTKERTAAVGTSRVFHVNYRKAMELKTQLDTVAVAEKRTGAVVADDTNNDLIVTDTPEGLAAVERLLVEVDRRPQQVLIEAKLVEVSLSKDLQLGVQWDYLGNYPSGQIGGQRAVNTIGSGANPLSSTLNPANGGLPIAPRAPFDSGVTGIGAGGRGTGVLLPADKIFGAFTFGRITNNYFLTATLTAAASSGKAKVLSDPKIATINGKEAKINITTQLPYVTSSVTSTGVATQTVNYLTTGIQLSVTPTINADGRVTLKVMPTVSKPAAAAVSAGATGAPAVDTRQAETNVLVRDGETIVIGGLITDSISNTEGKIPLLGDIPILGWLFKKKTVKRERVELLIFVTTKIMPD